MRVRPELRLDLMVARESALHAGVGIAHPVSTYVRLGAAAGAGVAERADGGATASAHLNLVGRFVLDPFRQASVGASVGGGLGLRYRDDRLRPHLLLVADVERGRSEGWMPFVQLGLGGGLRMAAGVRRTPSTGR